MKILKATWLLALAIVCLNDKVNANYPNMLTLSPNGLMLDWDYSNGMLTGELHVINSNWVMFGVQSQKATSTKTTDWIVAWLDNSTGIGHFSDRHSYLATSNLVQKDKQTDWIPLDAMFESNHFIVKFERPIMICDANSQDIDIDIGQMTVKYAFGSDYSVLGGNVDTFTLSNQVVVSSANVTLIPQSASSTVNLGCPEPAFAPVFDSQPTGYYTSFLELLPSVYRFYWNFTQTSITGEVHVKTGGWVGFGLSPNGGMYYSDVFVGWITTNGAVNFTVRLFSNV